MCFFWGKIRETHGGKNQEFFLNPDYGSENFLQSMVEYVHEGKAQTSL